MGTTFVSLERTSGPSATCTAPPLGGTGTATCTIASLDAGASASFLLVVKVGGAVVPGTMITNDSTVTSTTADHVSANNTAHAATSTTGPTAVRVRAFSAESNAGGPILRWRTSSEIGALGFNVFRRQNGKRIRVNASFIAARGNAAGSTYAYRDRRFPSDSRPLRYWLQVVGLSVPPAWYGPLRVQPAR